MRRTVFQLDQFGIFEADAEALRQVAREMIAADSDGGSQANGIAVIDHQLGRLRANVDQWAIPSRRSSRRTAA